MADASLLFKIKGDSSDAVKAFKDVEATAKGSVQGLTSSFAKGTLAGNLLTDAVKSITNAVISLGPALLDLAKNAAAYGAEINDAAQKTNVGTDSLQAFKFAAEASGESFKTVTTSLAKFSTLLGDAENNNKKAEKTLAAFNITATNTEDALKQAITFIGNLSTAEEQNAAAAELFKDKSGAMIQVMREMGFSVDGTLDKLKDMGGYMSQESVQAAAAYEKQMGELDKQLGFVGQTIGEELIPVLIDLSKEFSTFLKENKKEIKDWGTYIADSMRRGVLATQSMYTSVQALGEALAQIIKPSWERDFTKFWELVQKADELERQRQKIGVEPRVIPSQGGAWKPMGQAVSTTPTHRVDVDEQERQAEEARKAAEKRRKEREAAFQKELDLRDKQLSLLIAAERRNFEVVDEEWEKAFLAGEKTKEEYRDEALTNLNKFGVATRKIVDQQFAGRVQRATTQTERENIHLEYKAVLDGMRKLARDAYGDIDQTIADFEKKRIDKEEKEHKERLKRLEDELDEKVKALNEELEYETRIRVQLEKQNEEREKAQEFQGGGAGTGSLVSGAAGDPSFGTLGRMMGMKGLLESIGYDELATKNDILGGSFEKLGNMAGEAFQGMAQGVGEMVGAWVLYGSAGPDALRKMTASLLANLAAQAAVEAIMETARGFAALAKYMGVPTPESIAHFTSAAIFASVATAAAVTGRAVAGDVFSKGGAAGGGSAASSPSNLTTDTSPISRYGPMSGASGNPIVNAVQASLDRHAAAAEALNAKIGSMQPHEVMTRAENQKPGITATHAVNGISSNGGLGTRLQRVTGARR